MDRDRFRTLWEHAHDRKKAVSVATLSQALNLYVPPQRAPAAATLDPIVRSATHFPVLTACTRR
jgi:hypothetical protein